MDGTGPEVKTEAPPPLEPLGVTPATSADLHELEGLLRKPDPKITLCLTEDANLIDQLHNLTGIMPKFAQFNPPPAAPTPEPSPSAQRVEAEAAQSRSVTNEELTRSRADPGILRPDLRTAPQTRLGRRVGRSISMVFVRERRLHFSQ